MLRTIDVSTT